MDSRAKIRHDKLKITIRQILMTRGIIYISELTKRCPGYSGDEVEKACQELNAENLAEITTSVRGGRQISQRGFAETLQKLQAQGMNFDGHPDHTAIDIISEYPKRKAK